MSLSERWPLDDHHDLRDALLAAWDRPGYHDLVHLAEVLDRLDLLAEADVAADSEEGAGFDRTTVALAAWFHDAVYEGSDDDEEQSARWAERALPSGHAAEVARLVRMTAHHRPDEQDAAGRALSDADLAILAAPRERYDAYAAGVRADFAHVAEADFRAGRAAVLAELAARPHLFHTERAQALWEAAARANLERELGDLSGR